MLVKVLSSTSWVCEPVPNLLNLIEGSFLAQRKAAIVSDEPGTTRDVIETKLNFDGYQLNLYDTCGIRYNNVSNIEKEGVEIGISTVKNSDVVLIMADYEHFFRWHKRNNRDDNVSEYFTEYLLELKLEFLMTEETVNNQCIFILNKLDKIGDNEQTLSLGDNIICMSVSKNYGIQELHDKLKQKINEM